MAHFTRPPRAELCSSSWAKPCFLLQRLLLLEDDALGLVETLSGLQPDPLENIPLETFLALRWVTGDRTSFKLSFLHVSKCFLPPSPFSRLRTWKVLLPPVNLLLPCMISASVHLLDMFSVLLSFLDVREDEIAAHKLCLKISSPAV